MLRVYLCRLHRHCCIFFMLLLLKVPDRGFILQDKSGKIIWGITEVTGGDMSGYLAAVIILTTLVLYCIYRCTKSNKEIAGTVRIVLTVLLIPVAANAVIATVDNRTVIYIAYIFYLIGTNLILGALIRYSLQYCDYDYPVAERIAYLVILADCISVCLNPVFGHVYELEQKSLNGDSIYYTLDSGWYHYVHLGLSFIIIMGLIAIFTTRMHRSSKLYMERYLVIGLVFVFDVIWEFINVFTKSRYNMSMLGFMGCGILIYFFSVRYHMFLITHQMFNKVFENFSNAAFFYDDKYNCLYMNPTSCKILDIKKGDLEKPKNFMLGFLKEYNVSGREEFFKRQVFVREDGEHVFWAEYKPVYDKRGIFLGAFVIMQDRTEEEKKIAEERYLATHDELTGLLSMNAFYDVAEERLKMAAPDTEYLMMASNIREFKLINDVFGRDAGDRLLKKIASLITELAGPDQAYARIAADKFVLLLPKKEFNEENVLARSREVLFLEENPEYPVVNHIGIYEITDRNIPIPSMVDRARMAISSIKNNLVQRVAWYEDEMRSSILWEQKVTGSLDEAMSSGQIVPYLQAQVDVNGKVEGAEVLVRWQHPEEGLMAPGRFIDILENNGRIANLDKFMWEETCRILRKWKDVGRDDMYLSVNISPKDFYFLDIHEVFSGLVKKYDIDPKNLRLEITESIMMTDIEMKLQVIDRLRSDGFIVEMDDFGSGYSSLNLLKDMPVDVLKIDMVFLRKTRDAERAKIILQQIINMAQKLIIPVITEGVETEEQVGFLTDMGCEMFQGYYFAKPISLEEFEKKNNVA